MSLSNLMKAEDYRKIAEVDELLKKDPHNAELLVEKGRIFYSKMADDFAVEAFKKAIEVNPRYVDAYFWLADCLTFHFAEWDEAEVVALQGLQIDPERKDLIELLVSIRESQCRWKQSVEKLKRKKTTND